MRQIFRRISLSRPVGLRPVPVDRLARAGAIFRAQQSAVQGLQVRSAQDRALRRLFLRRRARERRARRPHGRALVRAPVAASSSTRLRTRQPLVLYASHPDFEQTNVVGGMIGEGTGGVTEGLKRRVVLPLAGTLAETDHVLGHELVHAFQYDISAQRRRRRRHRARASKRCRCGLSKGWPNICRSARSIRTRPCGCATRRARKSCREIEDLDSGEFFPVSVGAGRVGLHRRQVRRRPDRPDLPQPRCAAAIRSWRSSRRRSSTTKSSRPTGTPPSASNTRR